MEIAAAPFRELAFKYFQLVGIPVMDNGECLQIEDPSGMPVVFRFVPLAEGEFDDMRPPGMPQAPGAPLPIQYLGPGSKPFERILKDLRTRGRVVRLYGRKPFREREIQGEIRQWMEADYPGASVTFTQTRTEFIPWLLLNFKLGFVTDEKVEELVSLAVNLVEGGIREGYWQNLAGMNLRMDAPLGGVSRRRMPIRSAYAQAKDWILEKVALRDPAWAIAAMARMDEEISTLDTYYGSIMGEDDEGGHREERDRRLSEQKGKFKPRVAVDLVNMGVIYVPTLHMGIAVKQGEGTLGEWRLAVDGATEERLMVPVPADIPAIH